MLLALLSRRLRTWFLLSLLLPLVGRVLEGVGLRVGRRSPRVGQLLTSTGGVVRFPRGARRARRAG